MSEKNTFDIVFKKKDTGNMRAYMFVQRISTTLFRGNFYIKATPT